MEEASEAINDAKNEEKPYIKLYYPNSSSEYITTPFYEDGKVFFNDIKKMEPKIVALNLINNEGEAKRYEAFDGWFEEPAGKWRSYKVDMMLNVSAVGNGCSSSASLVDASIVKSNSNAMQPADVSSEAQTTVQTIQEPSTKSNAFASQSSTVAAEAQQIEQEKNNPQMESNSLQYQPPPTVASSVADNVAANLQHVDELLPSPSSSAPSNVLEGQQQLPQNNGEHQKSTVASSSVKHEPISNLLDLSLPSTSSAQSNSLENQQILLHDNGQNQPPTVVSSVAVKQEPLSNLLDLSLPSTSSSAQTSNVLSTEQQQLLPQNNGEHSFEFFTNNFVQPEKMEKFNTFKVNLIYRITTANLKLPFNDPLLLEKIFFWKYKCNKNPILKDIFPTHMECKVCNPKKILQFETVMRVVGHLLKDEHIRMALTQEELDQFIQAVSVIDYSDDGPYFKLKFKFVKGRKGKPSMGNVISYDFVDGELQPTSSQLVDIPHTSQRWSNYIDGNSNRQQPYQRNREQNRRRQQKQPKNSNQFMPQPAAVQNYPPMYQHPQFQNNPQTPFYQHHQYEPYPPVHHHHQPPPPFGQHHFSMNFNASLPAYPHQQQPFNHYYPPPSGN